MIKENASSAPAMPAAGPKLKGTFELAGETLGIFKKRWRTLVAIELLPAGLWAIVAILGALAGLTKSILLVIVLFVTVITLVFISVWASYALMMAIVKWEDGKKWSDYYQDGLKIFWGILGVSLLTGLAVLGGLILLIIPGLIFAVWFGFATWAYIERGKGSEIVAALSESKRVVKGYFWPIVWRNLVFCLIIGVPILIVAGILGVIIWGVSGGNKEVEEGLSNIIQLPFQVIVTPISLIFGYLLYQNVKELKTAGFQKNKLSLAAKILIPAAIIFMFLIPVGIISLLAIGALGEARVKVRDTVRTSDINQIKAAIEVYKDQKGTYPNALTDMAEIITVDNFSDPKTGEKYEYELTAIGFEICANMEGEEGTYCVTNEGENAGTGNKDLTD